MRNKIVNRKTISEICLCSIIVLISFNLIVNTGYSRNEFPSSFIYNDRINPNERVNYYFTNNILLTISSNIAIDLNIEYENRVENKQIEFLINNSQSLSLNISSKTSMGNFGMNNTPQDPKNQYKNQYDYYVLIRSNSSIEHLVIRSWKKTHLGFSSTSKYQLGFFSPTGNEWIIANTIEVLNETSSETYLETELLNLNGQTEYYLTYFEVVPVFDHLFWIILIVSVVGIASAVLFMISRSDYFRYLRQRTVPIEKGAHRLSLDEVLENDNRNKIIDLILKEPGIHFNELLRRTKLAAGNLVWHLDILETYKIIGKKRVGKFIAYFPYYQKNPVSNLDLKLSKSKLTLEILEMIEEKPGLWNSLLTKKLKVDHKTIQYHVKKLKELDLIRFKKDGRKKKIYPNLDSEYFSNKN